MPSKLFQLGDQKDHTFIEQTSEPILGQLAGRWENDFLFGPQNDKIILFEMTNVLLKM